MKHFYWRNRVFERGLPLNVRLARLLGDFTFDDPEGGPWFAEYGNEICPVAGLRHQLRRLRWTVDFWIGGR